MLQSIGFAAQSCAMQNSQAEPVMAVDMTDHSQHQMAGHDISMDMDKTPVHTCCETSCDCLINSCQAAINLPTAHAVEHPLTNAMWFIVAGLSPNPTLNTIDRPPIFA